jgi:hypothetical protein
MPQRRYPSDWGESGQFRDSGKLRPILLTYLLTFSVAFVLFLHGFHAIALVAAIAAWLVLAFWLERGGH